MQLKKLFPLMFTLCLLACTQSDPIQTEAAITAEREGEILAKFATAELKAQHVLLLSDHSSSDRSIIHGFERVAHRHSIPFTRHSYTSAQEFPQVLNAIKEADTVFFDGAGPEAVSLFQQMQKLNMKQTLVISDKAYSPRFLTLIKKQHAFYAAAISQVEPNKLIIYNVNQQRLEPFTIING
jgi:ABC-type branched-subunit amino acid transport system substrate-binding protein